MSRTNKKRKLTSYLHNKKRKYLKISNVNKSEEQYEKVYRQFSTDLELINQKFLMNVEKIELDEIIKLSRELNNVEIGGYYNRNTFYFLYVPFDEKKYKGEYNYIPYDINFKDDRILNYNFFWHIHPYENNRSNLYPSLADMKTTLYRLKVSIVITRQCIILIYPYFYEYDNKERFNNSKNKIIKNMKIALEELEKIYNKHYYKQVYLIGKKYLKEDNLEYYIKENKKLHAFLEGRLFNKCGLKIKFFYISHDNKYDEKEQFMYTLNSLNIN